MHMGVDMAVPDRPAHDKPYANGLTRQWTEVMCPTAVDNLEYVECDWDLPPRRKAKGFGIRCNRGASTHLDDGPGISGRQDSVSSPEPATGLQGTPSAVLTTWHRLT